jgi:glycosyltransferase involved in cell wall biosynthesis
MKVLVILTYYYPHWTGLTAYARRIAEGLVRRGHQVTVLASQHDRALPLQEDVNGVRVIRLPTLMRISRGVIMPGFPGALRRLIPEHDIVQVHTPILEAPLITSVARWVGRPVLLTHQGDLVMPAGFFNQAIERIVTWMMVQAEKQATAISVHSCDYAEHSNFLRPFRHKLYCIYPPVIIPRPDPLQVAKWRDELGLNEHKLVGYAGRFVEEKGFDYLYKAMPLVLEKHPHTKFVYAGERFVVYEKFYQRWEHLVEQNKEHLVFLGLLRDPQKLANFYAMCDVFCLPSRSDCFPSVQVEAILSGTPLVSTDIPGAREVIKRTGMGLLVKSHDERALAEGLIKALENPRCYVKPYEEIRAVFDPERSIDEYEALMQKLVREYRR